MSAFKSSIAMMVAGGAIGAAGHASAATITYDYSGTSSTHNVNILGVDEYSYGPFDVKVEFSPLAPGALTGTYSQNPTSTSTDTYSNTIIDTKTSLGPVFTGNSYLNLSFDVSGVAYLGTAQFTTVAGAAASDVILDSITYQPAGSVPEPDAWALLISGMGLAGAALRSRRSQAALAAGR